MKNLYYGNKRYKSIGGQSCPMPGREQCTVFFQHNGLPSIWKDGTSYVLAGGKPNRGCPDWEHLRVCKVD